MTHRLDIGGNVYMIDSPEAFRDFLKDRLGFQTADCFEDLYKPTPEPQGECSYEHECDVGVRVQETYQAVIQKAVEELREIKVVKRDVEQFNKIVSNLEREVV